MRKILNYFINNTLLVNIITLFIIGIGILSVFQIKREAYRNVDRKEIMITTEYPGASPKDVEINVTIPIEEKIKEISGIDKYTSQSLENFSTITVYIDLQEKNHEKIKDDIRRAVDLVTNLPGECKQPEIKEIKQNEVVETLKIGIFGKDVSVHELTKEAKILKKKILTIPYVSRVEIPDMNDREIHIKLNLKKMNEYYISMEEVIQNIKNKNIEVTGGTLESFITEKTIVTMSKFTDIYDVKNVIIRSNYDGKNIYLKDIANIEDTFEKSYSIQRYNGKKGFAVEVYKKDRSDIIKMSDSVSKLINEYKKGKSNKNIKIEILEDESEVTRNLLNIVYNNAIIGFILVIIILFIFMNFKNAFWSALGIPFAVFFSFIFFPFFDITINSISLMGLVIMLGIVVDDAIIISENIYRCRLENKNNISQIVTSISNIAPSVIASVITTIVAFLPILFWQSLEADFAREIPYAVIFILLGSLFEALIILPNHVIHIYKKPFKMIIGFITGGFLSFMIIKKFLTFISNNILIAVLCIIAGIICSLLFLLLYKNENEKKQIKEKIFMIFLKKYYKIILKFILRYRYIFILIFLLASLSIMIVFGVTGNIKFEMFPDNDIREFWIIGKTKKYKSLTYTSEKILEIEKMIIDNYYGNSVNSISVKCGDHGHPDSFIIEVAMLPDINKCKYNADYILNDIRKKMKNDGYYTDVYSVKNNGNPNLGRDIEIQLIENDDKIRNEISENILNYLNTLNDNILIKNKKHKKAIIDIKRSDEDKKEEIIIEPRYHNNSRYGISPVSIANTVRIAFDGYIVTDFIDNEETINYRLILDEEYRSDLSHIKSLRILNNYNKLVKINDLITIRNKKTNTSIEHYNGDKTITISADINKKVLSSQEFYSLFKEEIKKLENEYPGSRIIVDGMVKTSQNSINGLLISLLIALISVFFILILLFRSVIQSFIIMFAIPFGIVGVTIAFFFHGMTFSVFAVLGITGLCGVVVNNSLVMVDCINRLKNNNPGKKIFDLVIEGAVKRFRPVIITTLTTVTGLLPTAYGIGGTNRMIVPVAMSMTWGLIFSTILTLILIPSLYLMVNDITNIINYQKNLYKK